MSGIAARHASAVGGAALGVALLLALAIGGQELAKAANLRGGYWTFFGSPLIVAALLLLALLYRLGARSTAVPLAAAGISGYFLAAIPLVWFEPHPYGYLLIAIGSIAVLVALRTRNKIAPWEPLMSLVWGAIGYLGVVFVWLAFFYDWP